MSVATNTQPSFHAQDQFKDRVSTDVTLIESCWWDGDDVEVDGKDYEIARLYDGPLTDKSFVMFAFEAKGNVAKECDYIIRTVIDADGLWDRIERQ